MRFMWCSSRISAVAFTGGITWRGRHRLYLSAVPVRLAHTLKVIYGIEKAGITARGGEESEQKTLGRVIWEWEESWKRGWFEWQVSEVCVERKIRYYMDECVQLCHVFSFMKYTCVAA